MNITQPMRIRPNSTRSGGKSSKKKLEEPVGRALGLLLLKFQGPILEMSPETILIKPEPPPERPHQDPTVDDELVSCAREAFYQLKEEDRPVP
jgi:hypothetical protein